MLMSIKEFQDTKSAPYDICIIGSGAAGLTLAQSLSEKLFKICILESGQKKSTQEAQSLNQGECIGLGYDLEESRTRALGGTLHTWQGTIAPFDPISFEKRDWIPNSGWPISYSEMMEEYEDAYKVFGVTNVSDHFDGMDDSHQSQIEQFGAPTDVFRPKPFILLKMQLERLCRRLQSEVVQRSNVTCVTNATVVEIVPHDDKDGSISHVRALSFDGHIEKAVHAHRFVVCTGGLESPRLLLASQKLGATGIGNDHDVVGRYFLDHPRLRSTSIPLDKVFSAPIFKHVTAGGCGLKAGLVPKDDVQRQHQLGNYNVFLTSVGVDLEQKVATVLASQTANPADAARSRGNGKSARIRTIQTLRRIWRTMPVGMRVGIESAMAKQSYKKLAFILKMEQVPNPDSRILISNDKDRLGMPRLVLDWRLSDIDHKLLDNFITTLKSSFAARGFNTDTLDFRPPDRTYTFQDSSHPTGGTRMSDERKTGVVDKNLCVHGLKNLYVCSSSSFPTVCNANPTLTIVALACRLGKYLNQQNSANQSTQSGITANAPVSGENRDSYRILQETKKMETSG